MKKTCQKVETRSACSSAHRAGGRSTAGEGVGLPDQDPAFGSLEWVYANEVEELEDPEGSNALDPIEPDWNEEGAGGLQTGLLT